MTSIQLFSLAVILIAALFGISLLLTTGIFWTFNDWKQEKMTYFSFFELEGRFITGKSSIKDRDGKEICGKFLTFRAIIMGVGFGFDWVIERMDDENSI